ncbi:MAG TPA: T9SS type A sorting domain-containing protein, partial [Salinivirgaceae bacterium]|nr:T9SS type A sorting domain-containing protein [Salinivirgaceae bacterium]
PYQAVFLFGMGNRLWYTKKALNFNPIERFDWWDIHNRTRYDNVDPGIPQTRFVATAFSPDGDIAYGATEPNHQDSTIIYRISNLHACTRPKHAAFTAYHAVQDSGISRITHVQRIGTIKGRYISSLETDPKKPEVLIVTMGQYGNEQHVYVAKHAATTNDSIWDNNFVSIQGNLPKMPIYSACVNKNPNINGQLLVGTEHGVFVTDDYLNSNVTWQEANNGLGHYPVLSIKQRFNERKHGIHTYGKFVIATYGRGVFTDSTYVYTGIEDPIIGDHNSSTGNSLNIKLFPNPASDIANVSVTVDRRSVVEMAVYDLTGKLVYSHKTPKLEAGTYNLSIPVSEFTQGTYLVQCISGNARKTEKLLVK